MACFTAKAMVANKQLWEPQMCTFVHSKYSIFYYAFSNKENEKNRSGCPSPSIAAKAHYYLRLI